VAVHQACAGARAGLRDDDLADEVHQAVWVSLPDLPAGAGRLRVFLEQPAPDLEAYLTDLARGVLRGLLRAQERRRRRETQAARPETQLLVASEAALAELLSDLLDTLTPALREHCRRRLEQPPEQPEPPPTAENEWQLDRRLRLRVQAFMADEAAGDPGEG
jgi:hypothetical protein